MDYTHYIVITCFPFFYSFPLSSLSSSFSVSYQIEISSQDVIKEKKRNAFAGIDADDLKLWKVCIRDDELQELKSDDELLASRSDL
ncbi:hypothetical protein RIR_jg33359.t1 [Rhizophagus irregularis DAOM 181602=DAOM 197198]|nr:hypothetical protein RIR_jg33359.t1 [Rhizophagus irregularis DAOM 181602=DAOM 197198]